MRYAALHSDMLSLKAHTQHGIPFGIGTDIIITQPDWLRYVALPRYFTTAAELPTTNSVLSFRGGIH